MNVRRISEARREYARKNGIKFTQEDAAAYFGVSVGTYRNWEQGRVELNAIQLDSLSDLYGVTVDYLLGKTSISTPAEMMVCANSYEQEIFGIIRSLSPEGKKQLMVYARGCAATYPKNNEAVGA